MINLKSPKDISILREGGLISREILDFALRQCKVGVSTIQIDRAIQEEIKKKDVESWFFEVDNYPYASCIAVNKVWVHGLPNKKKLRLYDVVSVDIGIKYKGMYLDNCWTVVVQDSYEGVDIRKCFYHPDSKITKFLQVSSNAVYKAIGQLKVGGFIGDISNAMQTEVENAGYSLIHEYAGHGVGFDYHEEPVISCIGKRKTGSKIQKGLVVAVEVMSAMESPRIKTALDGWSVCTLDGKISGMFEHTVVATSNSPEVLTV